MEMLKNMDKFTQYCTTEQTKAALLLNAPIESEEWSRNYPLPRYWFGDEKTMRCYHIPTMEQMLGWLEQQGILVSVHYSIDESCTVCATKGLDSIYKSDYMSRNRALLGCIDKSLEYLKAIYDMKAVSNLEKVCEKDYRNLLKL